MERQRTFTGKHADVTDKVLKAFFKVHGKLVTCSLNSATYALRDSTAHATVGH